jgi:hypothetical protein
VLLASWLMVVPGPADAQSLGTISGTVTDATSGLPLAGYTVRLDQSYTQLTNEYGHYAFTGIGPVGHDVCVNIMSPFMYEMPTAVHVDLGPGQHVVVDFQLVRLVPAPEVTMTGATQPVGNLFGLTVEVHWQDFLCNPEHLFLRAQSNVDGGRHILGLWDGPLTIRQGRATRWTTGGRATSITSWPCSTSTGTRSRATTTPTTARRR